MDTSNYKDQLTYTDNTQTADSLPRQSEETTVHEVKAQSLRQQTGK